MTLQGSAFKHLKVKALCEFHLFNFILRYVYHSNWKPFVVDQDNFEISGFSEIWIFPSQSTRIEGSFELCNQSEKETVHSTAGILLNRGIEEWIIKPQVKLNWNWWIELEPHTSDMDWDIWQNYQLAITFTSPIFPSSYDEDLGRRDGGIG